MPSYEDLSKEQDAICVLAPLKGVSLVSGPPGTGKTVVAFYRAETAAKKGHDPRLVMFNKVLYRYSDNASENRKVQEGLNTWYSWLASWWKAVFKKWYPQIRAYCPDWEQMIPKVLALASDGSAKERAFRNWGHLIIDEGQDFSADFYRMARIVLSLAAGAEADSVALTVLADENQRLNADRNSSLKEIEKCLSLSADRHYHLTRNYRNTHEIARAAAHFYCGLRSGIPDLPDGRHGNKPCIMRTDDLDASVDAIKRFVINQSDLEIGVFLPSKVLQIKYFNKLSHRLKDIKGVRVQRYTSGDKSHGNAVTLVFDHPGVVTVLCDSSCKGLEFDAVFIPELQVRNWSPASVDHMRMQFYVLSSRARKYLTFMYSATEGEKVPILEHFPDRRSGLLEWIND